jgi:hypothetical protein
MNASMTAPARRELVEALRQRYAAATNEEKGRILSEFAFVSGLHRKSVIRVLNAETNGEAPLKRAGRPRARTIRSRPDGHRVRPRLVGAI